MSIHENDAILVYIHARAQGDQKIRALIEEKNNEVIDFKMRKNITFKKPDPAPSPKGDKRHLKNHKKQTMDDLTFEQKLDKLKSKYDRQIKSEVDRLLKNEELPQVKEQASKMFPKDLAILCEKGRHLYLAEKAQRENEAQKSMKLNLDDINQSYFRQQRIDYRDNSKSLCDKSPSPKDDFE